MRRSNRQSRSVRLRRLSRSDGTRWLAVVMLLPVLLLGWMGGSSFLVHGHDDHVHIHAVLHPGDDWTAPSAHAAHSRTACLTQAAEHPDSQGLCHENSGHNAPGRPCSPCDHGPGDHAPITGGSLVNVPEYQQLTLRSVALPIPIPIAPCPQIRNIPAAHRLLGIPLASSGGLPSDDPCCWRSMRSTDRIMRTDGALLI